MIFLPWEEHTSESDSSVLWKCIWYILSSTVCNFIAFCCLVSVSFKIKIIFAGKLPVDFYEDDIMSRLTLLLFCPWECIWIRCNPARNSMRSYWSENTAPVSLGRGLLLCKGINLKSLQSRLEGVSHHKPDFFLTEWEGKCRHHLAE